MRGAVTWTQHGYGGTYVPEEEGEEEREEEGEEEGESHLC